MQRLLNGTRAYVRDLAGATMRGWNAFFFSPADPTALGLIRAIVGLLLFWNMLVLGMDLDAFLGSHSWADPAAVRASLTHAAAHGTSWAWSFWFWIPDSLLWPAWLACLGVFALFALGLGSRVTALLAWAIAVSTTRRSPVMLFGFDQIVPTWTLYLAVTGASGQALSLDRLVRRWRLARTEAARRRKDGRWTLERGLPAPTVPANLALRLIQLHLVLIYGLAGLAKLRGDAWWNGYAVWGVVAAGEFRRLDLTWLATYPLVLNVLTHGGVFLELAYPVLVWNRVFRPLLIVSAILMHVAIDLSLGLTEFGVAMLAGNLAFVSGPWLRSLVTGLAQPAGRVLYDGACPRCRASVAWISAADPDHVVELIDLTAVDVSTIHPSLTKEACLRAMHLVRADGRVVAGYDAVIMLARWLPIGWPFGLIGFVPGVGAVGRRVYNALAASRPRDQPCTDDTCSIHARPRSGSGDEVAAGAESRSSHS